MVAPVDHIDEGLRKWATVRELEIMDAIATHGSVRGAARAMGVSVRGTQRSMASLRKRAALHGYAPASDYTHEVPEPLVLKGVSTLYDAQGNVVQQWVKSQLDKSLARDAIEEWVSWLVQDAKGLAPIIPPPEISNDDLLAVYPMGDPHFGLYAWSQETGEDFDLAIAERLTTHAIDRLVSSAPNASTALIAELGDFFHADNKDSRTPQSGHALDTDTRWPKVMQVGLRAMIHCIKRTLEKHRLVIVRIVSGNHDPHSSFALALALDAYFHAEPRVKVDLSPSPFWYYRFGKVLIGLTHGDQCKPGQLPGIMAADRPEDWGLTKHRRFYTGHIHHRAAEDFPGLSWESFRTLAARDAWHQGRGYRSPRDMQCIAFHREHGEKERHICSVDMLEAA
jgi:hypothetical protein